jgi:hypothetical protein
VTRDDLIGVVNVRLDEIPVDQTVDLWYTIKVIHSNLEPTEITHRKLPKPPTEMDCRNFCIVVA